MAIIDFGSLLQWSSWTMLVTGLVTFVALVVISAPYGRYSKDKGWGILVPAKTAWFIMESPNLWIIPIVFLLNNSTDFSINKSNRILLMCFVVHYVNRSIVFPMGMGECSPMPISVMLMAFTFCLWNGFNQAVSLIVVNQYPDDWIFEPRFVIGIALFYYGFSLNMRSDSALAKLRRASIDAAIDEDSRARDRQKGSGNKGEKKTPTAPPADNGTTVRPRKYVIPTGGMFEYVSCANYCEYCHPGSESTAHHCD